MTRLAILLLFAASAFAASDAPPKVLLVVAHPDDEYYFAATVYRIAQELGGTVDQVIITNGEGGYRYSALAEKIYGMPLTEEATGRRHLPGIRRKEALAAGRILGIRHHYFLNEVDKRFTLSAGEALNQVWDCGKIRQKLRHLLETEDYDFVFTMLPRNSTHGHHQAAALLALETVDRMDPLRRPVVLGAEPQRAGLRAHYSGLESAPLTKPLHSDAALSFNRSRSFGFQNSLRYDIVVQWMIAEHKSQGMFQNEVGRHDLESFWILSAGPVDAASQTALLSQQLNTQSARSEEKVARQ